MVFVEDQIVEAVDSEFYQRDILIELVRIRAYTGGYRYKLGARFSEGEGEDEGSSDGEGINRGDVARYSGSGDLGRYRIRVSK